MAMNTRENATRDIISFLQSEERFLLFTGTHQNEKHTLALSIVLSVYSSPATLLFRAGHSMHFENNLRPLIELPKKPTTGTPIRIRGGYFLYLDTINRRSWSKSPRNVDLAIVYPIDVLDERNGDECIQDILHRNAKKIMLISWTDNKDYAWIGQFKPRSVIFDAEDEKPEYHKKMLELTSEKLKPDFTYRLPQYAQGVDSNFLVRIWCRNCNSTRWARTNKKFIGISAIRRAPLGEYEAICLNCGYRAVDNYNWSR